ncbi:MAG: hypothetical protein U0840_23940 [Gemmataceae bacterium]
MSRLIGWMVLACLLIFIGQGVGWGASPAKGDKRDDQATKRAALWQALLKALPEKYREIDVYAENPSLTQVLFRSKGTTCLFSLRTGKVEPVLHMKLLPRINRITYEQNKVASFYALWYYGTMELSISADE